MTAFNQVESAAVGPVRLAVEFFEVEMSSRTGQAGCSSCDDARVRLARALELATPLFATLGVVPHVVHRSVTTERDARVERVAASPTIRVGDVEIRPVHRDNREEGRVWPWQGDDHAQPPVGMLVDLLIRGYVAHRPPQSLSSSDIAPYLSQFFVTDETKRDASAVTCQCG
jgi:hypothetical protein